MRLLFNLGMVWALACAFANAELLDRIVAKANRHPVLLSEVQDEIRFQELSGESPAGSSKFPDALQRIIDRVLIQQEITRALAPEPDAAEIQASLEEFKARVAGGDQSKWQQRLVQLNLTDGEIRDRLAEEIRVNRYIDLRFRATVRVDRAAVAEYYEKILVPKLRARTLPVPALRDVSAEITEILTEEQITSQMNDWLQSLRKQAEIEVEPDPNPRSDVAASSAP